MMYDESQIFVNQMTLHLNRILTNSPGTRDFIYEFITDRMEELAQYAHGKINLSLEDGLEHSIILAMPPVCFDMCILPFAMDKAASYFAHKYGGFGALLSKIKNQHPAFQVQDCRHLVSIVYGRYETKCWINMSIIISKQHHCGVSVIAEDLLTDPELVFIRKSI
ncbi:MAG: hypothetical protein IPM92_05020 [Saprospiraceae bacterium]|nr:hypothetical protein [Saprospiraceae bacterium]